MAEQTWPQVTPISECPVLDGSIWLKAVTVHSVAFLWSESPLFRSFDDRLPKGKRWSVGQTSGTGRVIRIKTLEWLESGVDGTANVTDLGGEGIPCSNPFRFPSFVPIACRIP